MRERCQMTPRPLAVSGLLLFLALGCEETRYLPDDIATSTVGDDALPDSASIAYDISARLDTQPGHDGGTLPSEDTSDDTSAARNTPYGYQSPPEANTPVSLLPSRWVTHLQQDIMPFWMQPNALGSPVGNFPTHRTMSGALAADTERRPRMIGRQVFVYCAAFLLSGDTAYLEPAHAGTRWLLDHAWDTTYGGWHARLDAQGNPLGSDPKTAQDAAYVALGLAAWHLITRDVAAEQRLLDTRDILMEGVLWDPQRGQVRDAVASDHSAPVDVENDGGAELVAQLDPVNGFLLMSQRVLSDPQRRDQFRADLDTLSDILVDDFFSQGMFWGVDNQQGAYGARHVDFGHNLKSFWMLLQVDKRLPNHPYRALLETHLGTQLTRAYDATRGRWAKRPTSESTVELGSDWWIWAECDQLAATLNLQGGEYDTQLAQTAMGWLDFVDLTRSARELVPTLDADGEWVYPWPENDTAKANQWKNGYHGAEHALIMYLHGHWRQNTPASLYFAPSAAIDTFVAPPYVWHATERDRTAVQTVDIGGESHTVVRVRYDALY